MKKRRVDHIHHPMHAKKKTESWKIALLHWLQAGFMIPMLLGLAFDLTWSTFIQADFFWKNIVTVFVYPLITFLGVLYSTRVIKHSYQGFDPKEILLLSTLYILIVSGCARIYGLLFYTYNLSGYIEMTAFALRVLVYYWASKKYLS